MYFHSPCDITFAIFCSFCIFMRFYNVSMIMCESNVCVSMIMCGCFIDHLQQGEEVFFLRCPFELLFFLC